MIIIVQARLQSSRLPHKALLSIGNLPSIAHTLLALKEIPADAHFLATDAYSYEAFLPIAKNHGYEIFSGSADNVLERFCLLIEEYIEKHIEKEAEKSLENLYIVRATGDNPFLFYEAIPELLAKKDAILSQGIACDYLTFTGMPHGSGVELLKATSLLKAWKRGCDAYECEHVGPALYNHKAHFSCHFIDAPPSFYAPTLRTTIDTAEDYRRALKLYRHLEKKRLETGKKFLASSPCEKKVFSAREILDVLNSEAFRKPLLYIAQVKKGFGTGHFRRALMVAEELDASFFVPPHASTEVKKLLEIALSEGRIFKDQILESIDSFAPGLIVLDAFRTEKKEIEALAKRAPVLALDEAASEKNLRAVSYVLDTIPSLKNKKNNLMDIRLLDFRSCQKKAAEEQKKPEKTQGDNKTDAEKQGKTIRFLISLGGEDPGRLALKAKNLLEKAVKALQLPSEIELLLPENPIPSLKERLCNYDIVITHYGLTAFEALASGSELILLGTSKIHEKLAKKYGFYNIPKNKLNQSSFEKIIQKIVFGKKVDGLGEKNLSAVFQPLLEMDFTLLNQEKSTLSVFLLDFLEGRTLSCPLCQEDFQRKLSPVEKKLRKKRADKVLERCPSKTIRKCASCSLYYPSWLSKDKTQYNEAYFFDDYKKQYGKTYLEDFSHIKARGLARLKEIQELKPPQKSILDIGCAYGPFLSAAQDAGFSPFGSDISKKAVAYVKEKLGFPAISAPFPQFFSSKIEAESLFPSQFGCLTMWFVIEHFENLDAVLKKVNALLVIGGVFAFSTPNGRGISMKLSKKDFFEQSPLDHFSIWHKKAAKKILQAYGFKVQKIKIEESHLERIKSHRFLGFLATWYRRGGVLKWLAVCIANKLVLSDTFEVYCIKKRNIL